MTTALARERAAQVWCTPETKKIVMDIVLKATLREAFAQILDKECDKTTLEDATEKELLGELTARSEGKPRLKKWSER